MSSDDFKIIECDVLLETLILLEDRMKEGVYFRRLTILERSEGLMTLLKSGSLWMYLW